MVTNTTTIGGALVGTWQTIAEKPKWSFAKIDIAIESGIIQELSTDSLPKGDYHIDAMNCLVLPPFSNAHTHGFEFAFKGFKNDRAIDEPHPEWFWKIYNNVPIELLELGAEVHFAECVMAGIGYVGEVLRHDLPGGEIKRILDGSGLRGCVFGGGGECDGFDLGSEIHRTFATRLKEAEPHSRIHMHVLENDYRRAHLDRVYNKPIFDILHGAGLDRKKAILTHCGTARVDDLSGFDPEDTLIVTTPVAETVLGEPGINLKLLEALSLRSAFGSDGPCYNPSLDMFQEMRTAVVRAKRDGYRLSLDNVLRDALLTFPKWLGEPQPQIEMGAPANLQIVSLRRLAFRPLIRFPYDNLLHNIIFAAHATDICALMMKGDML